MRSNENGLEVIRNKFTTKDLHWKRVLFVVRCQLLRFEVFFYIIYELHNFLLELCNIVLLTGANAVKEGVL